MPLTSRCRDNITLILGPAFLAASIYLCVGHLVRIYGEDLSALKVRWLEATMMIGRLTGYRIASDVSFDLCGL